MTARFHNQHARTTLLLCGLLLLAIVLGWWQSAARQRGAQSSFDGLICTISRPLQSLLLGTARRVGGTWDTLLHSRRLARENAHLAARVSALEAEITEIRESAAARTRRQALLSAYPGQAAPERVARVIGLGAAPWLSYLAVDRGSVEGIRERDVAVAREGLVGQVYAVGAHTSRIVPITDPASGVAARVQRSRETAILKGLGNWRCELRYLGPDADAHPGDQVITAGTGGIFPGGLRVGTITSVMADQYTPGKLAAVEPAVQLRNVEEILLLPGNTATRAISLSP